MKRTKEFIAIAVCLTILAGCKKEGRDHDDHNDMGPGHVYTITNDAKYNVLLDYRRSVDGMLTLDNSYTTGGSGTGSGLGSQGAVALVDDEFVLVVNAGSNSISSFKVSNHGLELKSTVNSGGEMPISIAAHDHVVVVLNAGGNGNISGFTLGEDGKLNTLRNSTRPLSGNSVGPAQVSFVNDGQTIVVTEKNANEIISYSRTGTMHTLNSANMTPFGFAVGRNGNIFVSEAAGGAAGASTLSSYHVDNNGVITLIKGPVATNQTSACWVTMTRDGKYAFTSNTASNNVSSFNSNSSSGDINLLAGIAGTTGGKPGDGAMSSNSKFFYVLTPGTNTLNVFSISANGSLTELQTVSGISVSGAGLAAK